MKERKKGMKDAQKKDRHVGYIVVRIDLQITDQLTEQRNVGGSAETDEQVCRSLWSPF